MFDISQDYWNDKEVEGKKDIFRLYIKENSEDVLRPDYENIERINRRGEACKPFLLRSIG